MEDLISDTRIGYFTEPEHPGPYHSEPVVVTIWRESTNKTPKWFARWQHDQNTAMRTPKFPNYVKLMDYLNHTKRFRGHGNITMVCEYYRNEMIRW